MTQAVSIMRSDSGMDGKDKCCCKNKYRDKMLKIVRGNDFTLNLALTRQSGADRYDSYDLTGWTPSVKIINSKTKEETIVTFTVSDNIISVPVDGELLEVGTYDIEVVMVNGEQDARSYACKQFAIVETNAEAYLPRWVEFGDYDSSIIHMPMLVQVGLSAYEIALKHGFSGSEEEWLASLKGETGAAGPPNTLSIGTVESGTTAAASISGTAPNQVLNLVLPQSKQGKFYGYFGDAGELPAGDIPGFAYVGMQPPVAIYIYDGDTWTDSGLTVNGIPFGNGEDIDFNADGLLQFANRVYDAENPNGMGYVILRKAATLASQVTDTNTIYEIRYDFDLNNASVTIPAGCVLRFNGGKIANGSIAFNGCSLEKDDAANIFENITAFSGNITGYFTPENVSYGLAGDCFAALLSLLKSSQTLLKVNTMSLTGDTDLQGVWLDATKIVLNGYTLRIGGGSNRITDVPGAYGKGENQNILSINTNGNRSGRVIVGRCAGHDLHIGHYNGKLEFVVDANNGGIAYSSFYLDSVSSIELSASEGVTGAWINTNRFILNRCVSFVVKSSLAYFNNNLVNMGCFEGAFKIRLERGNNNVFTDIRGEATSAARGELYFADTTFSNRVEIMFYPTAKIFDYGRGNIVRNNVLYDSRLIDKANISLQDLKKNLPSRIMGMTLSQDGTYMVPSSSYDVIGTFEKYFARYYQSGFIPYRRRMTIFALLEVISKNESGLGFTYELYDAEYNPLYVTKVGGAGVSLAMIRTTDSAYNQLTSGTFFNAFNMQANYRPGADHVVDNGYILFQFNDEPALNLINSGDEEVAATLDRVKYITISVVGNTYFYSFNSQLLSVGVSLYESGYKVRLFNSDVGETPSE